MLLNIVDHLASTRMNNPETNPRPGQAMPLQQLLQCGFDHWPSQVLNRRSQHNSQLAIAMLKSNLLDLLGIDESLEVDNFRVFAIVLRPGGKQKSRGAVSADRVTDDRFQRVIDVIASRANLDG